MLTAGPSTGKGSTAAFTAAILQHIGKYADGTPVRVGRFTGPYYVTDRYVKLKPRLGDLIEGSLHLKGPNSHQRHPGQRRDLRSPFLEALEQAQEYRKSRRPSIISQTYVLLLRPGPSHGDLPGGSG